MGSILMAATPAFAHGLGGRADLPVPRWLFVYGAATAVIVSFVALGALWPRPRLEDAPAGRPLPASLQRPLTSPIVEWTVRSVSLFVFVIVAAAAVVGVDTPGANIAPIFVWVWFWVGLAALHALFGNLWATLSPWDTLARLLDLGTSPRRAYPIRLGRWPAAVSLFAVVWMELVFPFVSSPRAIGMAIVAYTVVTLSGMALFGRETWNRNGECFAVYFGIIAMIAPLARNRERRVVVRRVLGGLTSLFPQPGLVPFITVALGSTTFDGFSRSNLWTSWVGDLPRFERTLASTAALIGMIVAVAALYSLAMVMAAKLARSHWHPLAVRFAHSLVPIALAYVIAHYFSLLVLEGQQGVALLSDPFGAGWNIFGTANWRTNFTLVSATLVWYVQVAAIVAGHIAGVVLAHDRAVAVFPGRTAVRTQYALLAIMVLLTVGGLVILSGG